MVAKKRGLGRGLDALLGADSRRPTEDSNQPAKSSLDEIPVEWIRPGKYQPRKTMDDEPLQELAASIRAQGVMQPILVRSVGENRYEIIAGERRWRATQLAGLDKIPAVIKDVNDEAAVAMSLIENIQREDLNPMEEALALQRLIEEFDLTHQQVADAVGKSRTAVSNFLRLINLNPVVAQMLAHGDIEMGHARALLSLSLEQQASVAREIAAQHLNVRQAEALVRKLLAARPGSKPVAKVDADTRSLENKLTTRLGQKVSLQHTAKGKGKLVIGYNSLDELDGILTHFGDLD
ncbi:MAG: ParB family chromosome partitioning protein [Patiriisocius sp.]|jgi:ParB family chromosome partitioning protein